MAASDDSTLIKVAVFGVTVSLISTLLIGLLLVDSAGDYDYDEINDFRSELNQFTGESMINQTPWILSGVYTPWNNTYGSDVSGHIDPDGWLYGEGWDKNSADAPESIKKYLGTASNIRMDPNQKSTVPIVNSDVTVPFEYVSGKQWWADDAGHWWDSIEYKIGSLFGQDPNTYASGNANIWDYTGYRYAFDPVLPFAVNEDGTPKQSSKDGTLSLVWYNYNGNEGLSGGLEIYGNGILLSSIAASDILANYNTTSGYATQYDFTFDGVNLNLLIRFDQSIIDNGMPLMEAWTQGYWTMAITSVSAGNFLDVQNSNSYAATAGSMIDTFVQVFTFNVPSIDNPLMDLVMWLLVGLPMMIALLCVTLRIVGSVHLI